MVRRGSPLAAFTACTAACSASLRMGLYTVTVCSPFHTYWQASKSASCPDTGTFPAYVNAVYFNGANFLDALRLRIGDEAFFAFLKAYYARQRGGIANAGAFFAILDEHTDADYSDLLQTYFYYR